MMDKRKIIEECTKRFKDEAENVLVEKPKEKNLFTKEYIINFIKKDFRQWFKDEFNREFKGIFIMVNTKDLEKHKADKKWKEETLEKISKKSTNKIEMYEKIYFSYIKFAKDKRAQSWGIAGCKSSFGKKYNSDVNFYDKYLKLCEIICQGKKNIEYTAPYHMIKHDLSWDTEEILIIVNSDPQNEDEAYRNETWLKEHYHLYD